MTSSSAHEVALYVLNGLKSRHGRKWLGARHPGQEPLSPMEKAKLEVEPEQLLLRFQLKGVGRDAHAGLLGWLQGKYPLDLRHNIPSARQMLDQQCEGRRTVTWMEDPPSGTPHPFGRHKNALDFLLHDLEHGHKFFGKSDLCRGQINFFRNLRLALPHLEPFSGDPRYQPELEYLMGDMNSHPLHMIKYLFAITLNAFIRQDKRALFDLWVVELSEIWATGTALCEAFLRINNPNLEREEDRQIVTQFFCLSPFDILNS